MAYLKENNDLVFITFDDTEDILRYQPGGYHPLVIGNIVQSPTGSSSYRILHKLGYGSSATVWLAERTSPPQQYVALKVSTAENTPTNEAKFLGAVSSPHIAPLIDAFTLEGPNGLHSVIVTEVLVPLQSYLATTPCPSFINRKKIVYDVARAVADLHKANCVHGDLYSGNVGISIPQLTDQPIYEIVPQLDSEGAHMITVVLPVDSRKATPSLPAYVVLPVDMGKFYNLTAVEKDALPTAKLLDFGNAHNVGETPVSFQCALPACSPEVVFAETVENNDNPAVEPPSDVWALGSLIYEIILGSTLCKTDISCLLEVMCLVGTDPPSHWNGLCPAPPSDSYTQELWHNKHKGITSQSNEIEADGAIRLLRRIFVLDPSKRPSAEEVCQDEWFKGLCSAPLKDDPAPHSCGNARDVTTSENLDNVVVAEDISAFIGPGA